MEEPIEATFGIAHGRPTIATAPPYELAGYYLMTASFRSDAWTFIGLLPALEELRDGQRDSVSDSTEVMYLEASPAAVVLSEDEVLAGPGGPRECAVPLVAFIDLLWRWWGHAEAVQAERAPQAGRTRRCT